jgi:hypothetical protein
MTRDRTTRTGIPLFVIDGVECRGLDAVPPEHRKICELIDAKSQKIIERAMQDTKEILNATPPSPDFLKPSCD